MQKLQQNSKKPLNCVLLETITCFTQSPLVLPMAPWMLTEPSGSTHVQLMHLEGTPCWHIPHRFLPNPPKKKSLMSNQPSWKWPTYICFTEQLVLQPAHRRSLNCTVLSYLYSKTCIFSLLQEDLKVLIDFRLWCTCHWYKASIHSELHYQTDCAFRVWINGSFHHKHELVTRSSRR